MPDFYFEMCLFEERQFDPLYCFQIKYLGIREILKGDPNVRLLYCIIIIRLDISTSRSGHAGPAICREGAGNAESSVIMQPSASLPLSS